MKDSYYANNPIFAEICDKIFNYTFVEFYAKLNQFSKLSLELLEIRLIEHDIVFYVYSIIYYTQCRKQEDEIYDLFCKFERSYFPYVMVTYTSSYGGIYDGDDGTDHEIVATLNIDDEFKRLLQFCSKIK